MNWASAEFLCKATLGGSLFSAVDGTMSQLKCFETAVATGNFWLGIYTDDGISWKSVDGNPIDYDLLLWVEGEPFNDGGNEKYVGYNFQSGGLFDFPDSSAWSRLDWFSSICDVTATVDQIIEPQIQPPAEMNSGEPSQVQPPDNQMEHAMPLPQPMHDQPHYYSQDDSLDQSQPGK